MKDLSAMSTKELKKHIDSLFAKMDSTKDKTSDAYGEAYHDCCKALQELNRRR